MSHYNVPVSRILALGFIAGCGLLLVGLQGESQAQAKPHDHKSHDHKHQHHAAEACRGFVVLPNGFAVLSGLTASAPPGHAGAKPGAMPGGAGMADKGPGAGGPPQHLLGYRHGQGIVPKPEMLCVPVGGAREATWTSTGQKDAPVVHVEALKGPLTSSTRRSASFTLAVQQGGKSVDAAEVRVLVRMPHHDRRLPGGHGPANDPDVKGLAARPEGPGRYTVPLVDFTMGGLWLLEIQVQRDNEVRKVYVAPELGEE